MPSERITRSRSAHIEELFRQLQDLTPELEWIYTGRGESFPLWMDDYKFHLERNEEHLPLIAEHVRRLHREHRLQHSQQWIEHCQEHNLPVEPRGVNRNIVWYARPARGNDVTFGF